MANVRVWNDNVHPYREKFKDWDIHIPPKSFIEMEEGEAILFRGTFSFPKLDADGNDMPEGFKMIRLEPIGPSEPVKVDENRCLACTYKASSKADLDEHVNAMHLEQMVDKDEQEKRIKAKAKAH